MFRTVRLLFWAVTVAVLCSAETNAGKKHHHGKHHKRHHHKKAATGPSRSNSTEVNSTEVVAAALPANTSMVRFEAQSKAEHGSSVSKVDISAGARIMDKMKKLEKELASKEEATKVVYRGAAHRGKIEVNGPLPADFDERFMQAVSQSTGVDSAEVKVVETSPLDGGIVEVVFEAPEDAVKSVEDQAADPESKLAMGPMHTFLVADESIADMEGRAGTSTMREETPVADSGIDVDTEMPYGELEPFGREDTAQELTEQSVKESDEMVDQLERAEVAEEKRAVFRALTRLRGAAITSFDGIARSQTGNIDEYNKIHKWRKTHPLHHLADEESDITKWAFPDNADF